MKRILLFPAIALLVLASCKKEDNVSESADPTPGPAASETVRFKVSLPALKYEALVRTSLSDDLSVLISPDEALAVYDGSGTGRFTAEQYENGRGIFEGKVRGEVAGCLAAFPFNSIEDLSSSGAEMTVPSEQGSAGVPVLAVGKATADSTIDLSHVLAYVEVEIEEGVTAVKIRGSKSEGLAGMISVDPVTGAVREGAELAEVVFTPEAGKSKGIVAMVPGYFEEGLAVQFLAPAGDRTCITETVALKAGEVLRLSEVEYSSASTYTISSPDDMAAWFAVRENWTEFDKVTLTADIDMKDMEWSPANFYGTFDGGGHRIYNLVVSASSGNAGFFNNMTGTMSDVVFGSADGNTQDGVSSISLKGSDDGEWHYAGIVARLGGDLKNVTNFIPVSLDASCTFKTRLAGVAGTVVKPVTVEKCINYGSVSAPLSSKKVDAETSLGGIVACCDVPSPEFVTVVDCHNHGNISSADSYTACLGGIVGNAPGARIAHIESCTNDGTITLSSGAKANGCWMGGIAGFLNGNGTSGDLIKDCINEGLITSSGLSTYGIGGIAGRGTSTQIKNCENRGEVKLDNENDNGQQVFAGGIAGYFYANGAGGSSIENCTNSGKVSANANQVNCIGGIVGTMRGKNGPTNHLIKDCTNSGSVTISRTAANANWQACGGIIGEQESSLTTIQGCSNSGAVRLEMTNTTAHSAGLNVGGIVGFSNSNTANTTSLAMSGNSNTGNLTLINNGSTSSSQSIGGIGGRILAYASSADDSSVCAIVRTVENAAGAVGAAVGVNNGSVTSPVLGGSVNGTTLTSANVADLAVGSGNAATGAVLAQ